MRILSRGCRNRGRSHQRRCLGQSLGKSAERVQAVSFLPDDARAGSPGSPDPARANRKSREEAELRSRDPGIPGVASRLPRRVPLVSQQDRRRRPAHGVRGTAAVARAAHPGVALGRFRRDNGSNREHRPAWSRSLRDRTKDRDAMSEAASAAAKGRTDRSAYAFWTRDTVRFSDIDRYRHINNVAVATYCETGRVEFAEKLWPGSTAGEGAGWVMPN